MNPDSSDLMVVVYGLPALLAVTKAGATHSQVHSLLT